MTSMKMSALDTDDATCGTAVLAVDDEPAVLSAISRLLRPLGLRVLTASGGDEALAILEQHAPLVGAVLSDYSMPGMTGAELLAAVRVRWPDITRVMLTGNADLPAAAQAVNEGQLSRLYTKPWQPDDFRHAITQSLEQHRVLVDNRRLRALADEQAARLEQWNQRLEQMVAERTSELQQANASLHRGLLETVKLLLTVLERRLPEHAARCREVARLAGRLAERAGLSAEDARRVQVAALVHDIGLIGLPDSLVHRKPAQLAPPARAEFQRHVVIGQSMLGTVEQLADMATWIRHHHERWDGNGYPDGIAGATVPLASRIIALADGYLEAVKAEGGTAAMWRREQRHSGAFDPELLMRLEDDINGRPLDARAMLRRQAQPDQPGRVDVSVSELQPGMQLAEGILTLAGATMLPPGEVLTGLHVERVQRLLLQGALAADAVAVANPPSAH